MRLFFDRAGYLSNALHLSRLFASSDKLADLEIR